MDLLCSEKLNTFDSCIAGIDPVIFQDMRVLQNLLKSESVYIPPCDYFTEVQNDIFPFMRNTVTTWMLEVCEDQRCEDQVFPLAVNFMDRFLCSCVITRQQLQLVSAVCLLLASKSRQCQPLTVDLLCYYSDYSIAPDVLRDWELVVLSKLKWNVDGVTGFDYVDHLLQRFTWGDAEHRIRRHALTLVAISYTVTQFVHTPPSVIATACVAAAAQGLNVSGSIVEKLCALTNCSADTVRSAVAVIEGQLQREMSKFKPLGGTSKSPSSATSSSTPATKHLASQDDDDVDDVNRQPETPTDIQEIHF